MILLVEDDIDDREVFMQALDSTGRDISFKTAANGVECLAKLDQLDILPDLIIADLNMPLMNGFDLIKALKESERYKGIPVIVMSTADTSVAPQVLSLGAKSFYSKPVDYKIMSEMVSSILSEYSL